MTMTKIARGSQVNQGNLVNRIRNSRRHFPSSGPNQLPTQIWLGGPAPTVRTSPGYIVTAVEDIESLVNFLHLSNSRSIEKNKLTYLRGDEHASTRRKYFPVGSGS
jgi:hypothetical protein